MDSNPYGSTENTEIIKILAPLTDDPNAPDKYRWTPIHKAALNGHTEIVKILAPLTDNPNAPDNYGKTPIDLAAWSGNAEIVNILKSYKNSEKCTRISDPSSKQSTKRPRKPSNKY